MSVHVVLIRPGATLYDEQLRVQGTLDLPLSQRGRDEVQTLSQSLVPVEMAALYHGPGESLQATAEAIGQAAGLRPRCLEELCNLDQGLWQGLQLEEIKRRNLKLFRQWLEDPLTICPPQGETVEDASARVKQALKPLWKRHRDQRIGIIVGEPLAQIVLAYLRGAARPQLEDLLDTGSYEMIDVAPEIMRNGFALRRPNDSRID